MKHSKSWQNKECQRELEKYRLSKRLEDWKNFRSTVKETKCTFFDIEIQEITSRSCGAWKLMNWVKKCKLLAIKAIQYNSQPYIELDNLQQVLYLLFNLVQNYQINHNILDKIQSKTTMIWMPFLVEELKNSITKCSNTSTPELNKLL